jgi:uncharacterized membrane protein
MGEKQRVIIILLIFYIVGEWVLKDTYNNKWKINVNKEEERGVRIWIRCNRKEYISCEIKTKRCYK